jgi:hypothetical protein
MANNTARFINEAQDAAFSAFGAFQGVMETQAKILKQLSAVQQEMIRQAVEASNDQLQLIS